jgi:hypothetical protein
VATVTACSGGTAAPSVASLEDPAASAAPDASSSPAAPQDLQEAFLAYAQCMREHGIDMPDPQVSDEGGGRFSVGFSAGGPGSGPGGEIDKERFGAADEACRPLLGNAIGEEGKPDISPEDEAKLLEFARCMRAHGIDMPDPGSDGMVFNLGGPDDKSFDREAFEAAQEACKQFLPGRMGEDGPSIQVGPGGGAGGDANGESTQSEELR